MKKVLYLISLLILMSIAGIAQSLEIQLLPQKDCNANTFCVSIAVNGTSGVSPFEIGTSSILLKYNHEALAFNNYNSNRFDGSDFCQGTGLVAWDVHAFDAVSRESEFNLVLSLADTNYSCPSIMSLDTIQIGTICFDILQQGANPEIYIDTVYSSFNQSIPNDGTGTVSMIATDSISMMGLLLCDCSGEGTPCDDQNVLTVNDEFDVNCNCFGAYLDSDNDGIYDGIDPCYDGIYEAENANLHSVNVYNGYAQFTGTGYVDYNSTWGDYVEFTVIAEQAGIYDLTFRYALESGNRPMAIYINNTMVMSSLPFPETGAWNIWGSSSYTFIFTQDTNLIRVETNGSNGPNLDHMMFSYCASCNLTGIACDDNDPCTENDLYDTNCDCAGIYSDSDNDGICDVSDICPGGDDNLDLDSDGIPDFCDDCNNFLIGSICDDGDPCTSNDTINSNCDCVGIINQLDSDNDGICDAFDLCPGGDDLADIDFDNIPDFCDTCNNLSIGLPCSDGDTCTILDFVNADCNCVGIYIDGDGDGVCNMEDQCEGFDDYLDADSDGIPDGCDDCDNSIIGLPCDDGDLCTSNDTYHTDCDCYGTVVDSDGDGVCDAEDLCYGFDDNVDSDYDQIPDSCDFCYDLIYQAEFADWTSGATKSAYGDYTGTGYVRFNSGQDTITFTVDAGISAHYNISIRYAQKYSGKTGTIVIDGVVQYTEFAYPDLAYTWSVYGIVSFPKFLAVGSHTIMLINTDSSPNSGPRIDYLSLCTDSYKPEPIIAGGNGSFEEGFENWTRWINWNTYDTHIDIDTSQVYCGTQAAGYLGHGAYEQLFTEINYLTIGDTMTIHFYVAGGEADLYVGPLSTGVYYGQYHYVNANNSNGYFMHDSIVFVATESTMLLWFDLYPGNEVYLDNISFEDDICAPELYLDATDISCIGNADGSITAVVDGGAFPYTYQWSTGDSIATISALTAGMYGVTITDGKDFSAIDQYEIIEPFDISVYAAITNSSDSLSQDGNILLTVYGGTNPFQYQWSDGTTTQNLNNVNGGTYSVTLSDQNGCNLDTAFEIGVNSQFILPDWTYHNSGLSHIVLVQSTTELTIDDIPINSGDMIGAFYDSSGTLACAGYMMWQNTLNSITVFGDDSSTPEKDGFDNGEELQWLIWDATEGAAYLAEATYLTGIPTLPDSGLFVINGISGLESLHGSSSSTQTLNLNAGWDIISTYIDMPDPDIAHVFDSVVSNLVIIKDGMGDVYWPQFLLNHIGNMTIGEGYQILMLIEDSLSIEGDIVQAENHPITLPANWSMLGYPRTSAASIEQMLAALGSNLVIVKNGDGQVYWPAFYVNVIGNMLPGKGYLINLSSGQTFSFPANTANTAKSFVDIPESQHFILDKNTGSNMTLGMPERLWNDQLVYGSEIGVFSLGGQLVGTEVYTGSNLSVTIWGNDEHSGDSDGLLSGEEFHIRLWNPNTNIETDLVIKQWLTGDQRFKHNKISIADLCDVIQGNADIHLYQNIPNPFNGSTSIKYYLPDEMEIELSVLNVLGETIAILDAQNSQTGEHTHKFSKGILKAGTYYYRLATPNLIVTKKMVVLE